MSTEYRLRISKRARRLQLKIDHRGELEVVMPEGFDHSRVEGFVLKHQDWIGRVKRRVSQQRAHAPELNNLKPSQIDLRAINQTWKVHYLSGAKTGLRESTASQELYLNEADTAQIGLRLKKWLHGQAQQQLTPWLQQTSQALSLPYNRVTIRHQKTRWGSCSSKGTISLNRNLLFLPAEQVRYLFIHELCHTLHMNHSARYWQQVARFEPDYPRMEQALNRAVHQLPLWALPD